MEIIMARTLWKVGGNQGEGSAAFVDDGSGVVSLEVNGTQVVGSQEAAIVSLTDSSGGTANDTITAVPSDTLGNVATAANNNFADVAAKIEAILDALRAYGVIAT